MLKISTLKNENMNSESQDSFYDASPLSFSYKGTPNVISEEEPLIIVTHIGTKIVESLVIVSLLLDDAQEFVKKWGLFTEIDFDSIDRSIFIGVYVQLRPSQDIDRVLSKKMIQFPKEKPALLLVNILTDSSNTVLNPKIDTKLNKQLRLP